MNAQPRRRYAPDAPTAHGVARPVLNSEEAALAELFDGERDARSIRQLAAQRLGLEIDAESLERFASELAIAGLLLPGRDEPLPSPPLTEAGYRAEQGLVRPPSTLPGSLAGPGLMGSLLRLATDRAGIRREPFMRLPAQPWTALGAPLIAPLAGPLAFGASLLLLALLLLAVWQQRLAAEVDLLRLFTPGWAALMAALGFLLLHSATTAARAAAIARHAGFLPVLGLIRSGLGLPLLYVDSGGAAEASGRAARSRIVAAGLSAPLVLAAAAALLWFLSRGTATALAPFGLGLLALSLFTLLVRANPLSRLDGYYLLAQQLGISDLREQALAALFGFRRSGWVAQQQGLALPTLRLYWALVAINMLLLLGLLWFPARTLLAHFGAPGVFPLLLILGVSVNQTFRNARSGAGHLNLGQSRPPPFWQRSRRFWITLAVLVLLSCLPYRYHPSGDFTLLPGDRADVRALIDGDIREVLVKEGDLVSAGQVLARIADDAERAQVAGDEARRAQLEAELSLAGKGGKAEEVELAQSALDTARKRAEVSGAQARRMSEAYKRKSVTAQDYERARGQADVDQKALEETRRRLDLVKSPAVADRIAGIEAQLRELDAQLVYHRQQLASNEIKAPIAGRVLSGSLMFARGSYLHRGDKLAVIEDDRERLAEVRLPEAAIGEVAVGKPASARVWAYPTTSFAGEVRRIAPAAEDGAYGKVVRVQLLLADPDHRLLPGMTGNARLQGDWHPAIVVFSRALARFLFVEVWSWIP